MAVSSVSVIIRHVGPTAFLERAICSALDQGVDHVQVLVVTNMPADDETHDLHSLYADDVVAWHADETLTEVQAINWGLQHVTGDVVTILNSDDMLLPGAIENALASMRHQSNRWLVSGCMLLDTQDRAVGHEAPQVPSTAAQYLRHDAGYLPLTGSFFHRSLFEQFGLLEAAMAPCFDYEFACRLLLGGEKPLITTEVLVARHDTQRLTADTVIARGMAFIEAARRHARSLPFSDRLSLWKNCEHRRRIYALAAAELQGRGARQQLWADFFRHPWWALDDSLRHAMLYGIARHRPAAAAA